MLGGNFEKHDRKASFLFSLPPPLVLCVPRRAKRYILVTSPSCWLLVSTSPEGFIAASVRYKRHSTVRCPQQPARAVIQEALPLGKSEPRYVAALDTWASQEAHHQPGVCFCVVV